jgi:hypothetical protein
MEILILSIAVGIGCLIAYQRRSGRRSGSARPQSTRATSAPALHPKPLSASTTAAPARSTPPVAPSAPATSPKFFISYRRDDSADVTGRIYDRLTAAFGEDHVFKDVDSIPLGFDFREHLDRAVSKCDIVLVVIGSHWSGGSADTGRQRLEEPTDLVRIEIESALRRNIPVIPVLVRGATMPHESALPESLRSLVYRNAIAVRSDPDFHTDMNRLITACKKLGEVTQPHP